MTSSAGRNPGSNIVGGEAPETTRQEDEQSLPSQPGTRALPGELSKLGLSIAILFFLVFDVVIFWSVSAMFDRNPVSPQEPTVEALNRQVQGVKEHIDILEGAVDKRLVTAEREISEISLKKIPDLDKRLVAVSPTAEFLLMKRELEDVKRSLEALENKTSELEKESP